MKDCACELVWCTEQKKEGYGFSEERLGAVAKR